MAGPISAALRVGNTVLRHLEALRRKLTSRVGLLRRLAGSSWGAATKTLRTALYCLILCSCVVPQQLHSPYRQAHQRRTTYNNRMPTSHFSGQLTRAGRHRASGSPTKKSYNILSLPGQRAKPRITRQTPPRLTEQQRHFKSRKPFVLAALELLRDLAEQDATPNLWLDHRWNSKWQNSTSLHNYIKDVSNNPSGMTLQG